MTAEEIDRMFAGVDGLLQAVTDANAATQTHLDRLQTLFDEQDNAGTRP